MASRPGRWGGNHRPIDRWPATLSWPELEERREFACSLQVSIEEVGAATDGIEQQSAPIADIDRSTGLVAATGR